MDNGTLQYLKDKVAECDRFEKAIKYRKGILNFLMGSKKAYRLDFGADVAVGSDSVQFHSKCCFVESDFLAEMEARAIQLLEAEIAMLEEMFAKI